MERDKDLQLIVISKKEGLYQKVLRELEEECFRPEVLEAHSLSEAMILFGASSKGIVIADPESFQSIKRTLISPDPVKSRTHMERTEEQIAFIRYYIRMHLGSNLSLARLASELRISPNYLCTLFHKVTGVSVKQFIDTSRMEKATYLLETENCLVCEVAMRVGFTSVSYFCKVFKKRYGETPHQYRQRHHIQAG